MHLTLTLCPHHHARATELHPHITTTLYAYLAVPEETDLLPIDYVPLCPENHTFILFKLSKETVTAGCLGFANPSALARSLPKPIEVMEGFHSALLAMACVLDNVKLKPTLFGDKPELLFPFMLRGREEVYYLSIAPHEDGDINPLTRVYSYLGGVSVLPTNQWVCIPVKSK